MADEGGGAPGWIMTFADLMSLLLAFFVLLFSFSSVEEQKFEMVGGSMAEAFGVQRRFQLMESAKGVSFIATEFSSAPADPTQLNVIPQENLDVDRAFETNENPETGGQQGVKGKGDVGKLNEQKSAGKEATEGMQSSQAADESSEEDQAREALEYVKDKLADQLIKGELEVELDGDQVVINVNADSSFEKGSVEIKDNFKGLMKKIGEALGDVEGEVMVSGHTDNEPITSTRFRSNWELSASRAVTVLHGLLEATSIKPKHFIAMGHGDTRPRADNNTPEGREKNRRVEVRLRYDAIKISKKREREAAALEGFEKSIEELDKNSPAPVGENSESVFDIIMRGFR